MLRPKPGKSYNWLPNQVIAGVDTSDPDPEKWTKFGSAHEEAEEKKKHSAPKQSPPA
jgi:hypothetical protein